ncbi:MAG: TetR family transcriptional regulator [uncultured bacterium]|nr:MAG: TetR family transcriptional regulator [uncultured bacterium]
MGAAVSTFSKKGYHNTLISDIVTEARVGQGTFYRHFTDKREIFLNLKAEFVSNLISQFSEMSTHLPQNFAQYRQASIGAVTRLAHQLNANKKFVLCLIKEAPTIDKELEGDVTGIFERFAELAKMYLDHAIRQGFARPCHSGIVSHAIVGMGVQILMQWLEGRFNDVSVDRLVEELVDFGFLGVKK